MKKTMLLLFALMLSSAICAQDYHVVLWDNTTAPTSNGLSGDEVESSPDSGKHADGRNVDLQGRGQCHGTGARVFPRGRLFVALGRQRT